MKPAFVCLAIVATLALHSAAQEKPADHTRLYPYEGTYEFAGNRRITLGIFDEFKRSLVYLDLKTLKQGALVPVGGHAFTENNDASLKFSFDADSPGRITGLTLSKPGRPDQRGKRVMPHIRTPIEFTSHGRRLRGDVYRPDGPGRRPFVVFAHGSGPSTRGVSFFTTYFLQLGIGVLTFDKQGAGESEGDWETASFEELSDDVAAGMRFLKTQSYVNPKKIGILGNSQGGWTGPMAALKFSDTAFVLMRVGSGESVLDTVAHEYKSTFIADGLSEADANEAVAMFREHWTAALNGGTWEDGNNVILKYADRSWFKTIYKEPRKKSPSSEKWWTWVGKNMRYDSADYLSKLRIPVLWLMAELDRNVNSQAGEPRIVAALKRAGNRDYTVKILPGMAHSGLTAKTGYHNEPFSWQYAPGFWDTMARWLVERGFTSK